jgi:hypothetical protein
MLQPGLRVGQNFIKQKENSEMLLTNWCGTDHNSLHLLQWYSSGKTIRDDIFS